MCFPSLRLAEPFGLDGHQIPITASAGIVERAARGASPKELVRAADITVGEHPRFSIFGLGVNRDTLISTLVAGAILIGLGLIMRAQITDGVPGKLHQRR